MFSNVHSWHACLLKTVFLPEYVFLNILSGLDLGNLYRTLLVILGSIHEFRLKYMFVIILICIHPFHVL